MARALSVFDPVPTLAHMALECAARDPEASFLQQLKDGDPAAFERLVRREGPRLLQVARRILRDEEEARDAVQDAFLSAFKALPGFDGACRVSTWLHRIVVNAALMKLRRARCRPEARIDELLPDFDETGHHRRFVGEWPELPDHALLRRERAARVRACIDQLPDAYRTVLLLREAEERSTSEVAELLGTSEGAVKVKLHRARQALRTLLEREFLEAAAAPQPKPRRVLQASAV